MSHRILPLLLVAGLAPGAEFLVICSGQSNMDGRAPAADCPAELREMPPNLRYYAFGPNDAAKPTPRTVLVGEKDRWGPAPVLALNLAKARPADVVVVVKYAVGGTALWQWVPDYEAPGVEIRRKADAANGHLYATLSTGLQAVRKLHPQAKPVAATWLQGESDGKELAPHYAANLNRLVANLRRDAGEPAMAFISADPAAGQPEVYAALNGLGKTDPLASHITCRELPHLDGQHYNAKAILDIGGRYAAEILKRLP